LRIKSIENPQGKQTIETSVWQVETTDQQDRISEIKAGNGVHTHTAFDWRGLSTSTQVITDGSDDVGDSTLAMVRLGHDGEGNVTSRSDDLQPATETFAYDAPAD
jgi:hypothetical protein